MYCPSCGASNVDHSRTCALCGKPLPALPGGGIPAMPSAATPNVYAGFWQRAGAYVIDLLVVVVGLFVFSFALGIVLAIVGTNVPSEALLVDIVGIGLVLGIFLYYTLLESSARQATLGKLALDIKITSLTGERITFARAAGRFLARLVTSLTYGIGYLVMLFTKRRQTLHDLIAGTLVVQKRADAAAISAGAAAQPLPGVLVVIIVLVALIPIAGIFAAITLPAYRDYTIRAQVSEGLVLAGLYRTGMAEARESRGLELADIDSDSVGRQLPDSGRYVQSVEIISGAIVVTYGAAAHSELAGRRLSIVPALNRDAALEWSCGYASPPPGFDAIFENHRGFTDVPERYLPAACRR